MKQKLTIMKQAAIFCLSIISAGLLTIGCNNKTTNASNNATIKSATTFNLDSLKEIIQQKNNAFMKAHIEKDTAYLNNSYTKDGKVFAPNTDVVAGRSAIAALNLEWVNYGIKEAVEKTTAFYGTEEYLIDEGTYYMVFGEENTVDKGKYINIWKQEDGEWKLYSNIWNSNQPAVSN